MHNRFKLPGALGLTAVAVALAVFGAVSGRWVLVVIGVIGGAYFVALVITMGRGRNPWWMRSPLDPEAPPSEAEPERRWWSG